MHFVYKVSKNFKYSLKYFIIFLNLIKKKTLNEFKGSNLI